MLVPGICRPACKGQVQLWHNHLSKPLIACGRLSLKCQAISDRGLIARTLNACFGRACQTQHCHTYVCNELHPNLKSRGDVWPNPKKMQQRSQVEASQINFAHSVVVEKALHVALRPVSDIHIYIKYKQERTLNEICWYINVWNVWLQGSKMSARFGPNY